MVLVVGEGTCGVNGNSRIFYADQVAGPESKHGSIDGTYGSIFNTKTELIGNDNALLYQVTFQEDGRLYQSQLTTLTTETNGTHRRTRNAQSFDFNGVPSGCSFYREYKVEQDGM